MELEKIKSKTIEMILKFSIPSIVAMVLTSFITVADGFFIGNYIGKDGIAAVNLGLPVIYLFLAAGLLVSVGGAALAGMALGAGEQKRSNQIFHQTVVTTIVFAVLTAILVFIFFDPMLDILGAAGQVREHFEVYYVIMLPELVIMLINSSMGMFIRAEGSPGYYMKISIMSVLINIFLDYIFVGPMHLGIAGVAVASLLAEVLSLIWSFCFFWKRSRVYRFELCSICGFWGKISFDTKLLKHTLFNGSSEFIGELSVGIAMFAYNFVIMRCIGVDGVTAFTIVGYVAYVFSMIVVGFGQGASPLISYCYGAGERRLAGKIRRCTSVLVFAVGAVTFLLMTSLSDWYGSLFVKSAAVQDMICSGMVLFMLSFFFSGINAITSFYFTATGRAGQSAVISLSRGLVVLLVCIFVLPVYLGMTGIWLAAPVTEAVTLGISVWCLMREQMRKEKKYNVN